MKKTFVTMAAVLLGMTLGSQAQAGYLDGGDALTKASADVILDIAFAIDTSGSMSDDQAAITNAMGTVVRTLDCPDCNVWVQASFYGIAGTWGASSLFNESINGPAILYSEDNAPAVVDLITYAPYASDWMIGGATADQDYYKAIVTIGDEGTYNGDPVDAADWAAADLANQTAIDNGVFIFSITGSPYYTSREEEMWEVFKALAVGGSKTFGSTTYNLANTGGTFAKFTEATLVADLQKIICTAASGGNPEVPEPATMLLFGTGLAGLAGYRRRKMVK